MVHGQARHLEAAANKGTTDPFVVVRAGGETARTRVKKVRPRLLLAHPQLAPALTRCTCVSRPQLTCNPVYYQTVRVEFKALQLSMAPPVRTLQQGRCANPNNTCWCTGQVMVEVWDYDRLSANQLIGTARVSMQAAFVLPHNKVRAFSRQV